MDYLQLIGHNSTLQFIHLRNSCGDQVEQNVFLESHDSGTNIILRFIKHLITGGIAIALSTVTIHHIKPDITIIGVYILFCIIVIVLMTASWTHK